MLTEGGELAFLTQMLNESFALKQNIQWFTSLVGRREDFSKFLYKLKTAQTENLDMEIETAEFVNGKTVRWGIAWAYRINSIGSLLPSRPKKK
ncbi:hypothetical protein HK100_002735 [Physocladia obscura]|uniref:Uncharacterized protein n=1 Tax=Physocladia obscura TaxID=109957 RepID=A0AAD5XE14_9FUNG|nr:hypothetical protein HK100_002735 [Physocladia obscura]